MKVGRARETRQKGKMWQWVEYSTTSGRVLKVLLQHKDYRYFEAMVVGWKRSEGLIK